MVGTLHCHASTTANPSPPCHHPQNVHDIGWLALVATGCMFGAVATTLIKLLAITGDSLDATSLVPPHSTRTIEALIAVLNCFFAFGGQVGGPVALCGHHLWTSDE